MYLFYRWFNGNSGLIRSESYLSQSLQMQSELSLNGDNKGGPVTEASVAVQPLKLVLLEDSVI